MPRDTAEDAPSVPLASMGRVAGDARKRQDGERAHALGAVDQDALDVRGRRGTSVKRGVMPIAEFGTTVGVVQIKDYVGGIEQYD